MKSLSMFLRFCPLFFITGCISYEPDFITPQNVRIYLDGVSVRRQDMSDAVEVLLGNLTPKNSSYVRKYLSNNNFHILFSDRSIFCGSQKSYGCFDGYNIEIYVPDCPFSGALAHEFTHFSMKINSGDADNNHDSGMFCEDPNVCYENTSQKMLSVICQSE